MNNLFSNELRPFGLGQGWINDMGINGPTFVPKKWLIFTNLGQGLSQKVSLFLISEPILRVGFFDKMLALSNKKSTFVLVSGFYGCCIVNILFKYYLKGHFLTKRHLTPIQAWAHCAPLRFSFICCSITTKLGMIVLWDKISQRQ